MYDERRRIKTSCARNAGRWRGATAQSRGRLTTTATDVIIRTMPSRDETPELWWLLEGERCRLQQGLADRAGVDLPLSWPPSLALALGPAGHLFPVHLLIACADRIRRCHTTLGIPDDVSWETIGGLDAAMDRYRARFGHRGLDIQRPFAWMTFTGHYYRVGRLTVTPYRLHQYPEAGPTFWYDDDTTARLGPGFVRGAPARGLHIPADRPLSASECDDALNRIRSAFLGYFGDEPPRLATCTSWLLDDQLAVYLPPTLNILAFQQRFTLAPGSRDDDAAWLRRLFDAEPTADLDTLPQETTLQRIVVAHLRDGGHWRVRTGWLEL